jgi:hypothetical protein
MAFIIIIEEVIRNRFGEEKEKKNLNPEDYFSVVPYFLWFTSELILSDDE